MDITEKYLFDKGWLIYNYNFYSIGVGIIFNIKDKKIWIKKFLYSKNVLKEYENIMTVNELEKICDKHL